MIFQISLHEKTHPFQIPQMIFPLSLDHVLTPIYLSYMNNRAFQEEVLHSQEVTNSFLAKNSPLFQKGHFTSLLICWLQYDCPLLPGKTTKNQQNQNVIQFNTFGNLIQINSQMQPLQTRTLKCLECNHSILLWENERKPIAIYYTAAS